MTVPGPLRELSRRDPLLARAGWIMLAGAALAAMLAQFDGRTVLGINPWIKPIKFFVSIGIFLWTMAWFMPEADPRYARRLRRIRWTFVITLFGEVVLISMQSARGTTSHFNVATTFDARVFDLMGAMIVANTVAAMLFLFSLRRDPQPARAGYLLGLRLGLIVFVAGSLEGFAMALRLAHGVPGPDGGPGLPFVNWSTTGGDLRVAHFLGLHALQALPMAGHLLDRAWPAAATARSVAVGAIAVGWVGVTALAFALALGGRPLPGL